MNISITFRQMDPSEAIKSYAREKVAKLQKFLRQPMTARITLSLDRLEHVAETRVSSGGAHIEAKEASEDMYVSIDRVIGKLERQIRGAKGASVSKKRRSGDSLRNGALSTNTRKKATGARGKKKRAKKARAASTVQGRAR